MTKHDDAIRLLRLLHQEVTHLLDYRAKGLNYPFNAQVYHSVSAFLSKADTLDLPPSLRID